MLYAISYYSGLQEIVRGELHETIGETTGVCTLIGKRHDFFVFEFSGEPGPLLGMRSVENVFILSTHFEGIAVSKSRGLAHLKDALSRSDFSDVVQVFARTRGIDLPAAPDFRIALQVQGHHKFSERDVDSLLKERLDDDASLGSFREGSAMNIRLQIIRDKGFLGLQLPPRALRNRPYKLHTRSGSLDPTVAHCLARLVEPTELDVFLDPMCGAGTIAIEARAGFGLKHVNCGDIDPDALRMTKKNADAAESRIQTYRGNVLQLPFHDASVDKVVANLPYGKDIPLVDPHGFVRQLLKELGRIVRRGGKIVLLSTHGPIILRMLKRASPFCKEKEFSLDLYGFDASILVLKHP